ncbi:MAG TPA: hypothetical protein VNY52_09405, partial [Solirubrobacteraceae bacterium]|nr:hypothetical protein [Solirubrobacteraceae bacterium]
TPPLPPAHPDGAPAAPASRRGGAIVLGGLAVAVIAAVALIVGLSSGGGSTASPPAATGTTTTQTGGTSTTPSNTKSGANGSGSSTSTTSKAGAIHVDATLPLTPPNSSSKALGIVEVASRGGARVFLIAAEHLPPTTGFRYAAWLYNSTANEAFLLGQGPTVGSDGKLTAAGGLPATAAHYSEIILTEETSEKPTHPGSIVLGGAFKLG